MTMLARRHGALRGYVRRAAPFEDAPMLAMTDRE